MQRTLALLGSVAASTGLLAGALAMPIAGASSHREAPMIANDPYADLTDLYAFRSPDTPDTVTLILNAIPYENPMAGPNFYRFDDGVRYEIHIAQAGHNTADITYRMEFNTQVKNPGTFLYNTGPIDMPADPDLNVEQTARVTKVTGDSTTVLSDNLPVQPVNIGVRSNGPTQSGGPWIRNMGNGEGWFYAGQRADPFFLDLSVFDLLTLRPFNTLHKIPLKTTDAPNSFTGFNVHTIAMQIPITKLTTDGQPAAADGSNSIIGIWATTSRQQTRVLNPDGTSAASGQWVQIERLGNPLVNEVVVPLGVKDHFNATPPEADGQFLPAVTDPELGKLVPALFPVQVPPAPRNDLVTIFLTGIPGLNKPANVMPAELLRLNMGVMPSAPVGQGQRMGVLAGDNAGYPNGRRLEDDVVDIALQAVAGATPLTPDFNKAPNNQVGDGVNQSAKGFNDGFPYLSEPYQGTTRAGGTTSTPSGQ